MIKIEYLLPFNTENGICKDINSFNSLLASHSDISIVKNKIRYKNTDFTYKVNVNEVPNQECTVYHIVFENSSDTDDFREMLKSFKKTVGVYLKDEIQIIWNGLGFNRSKELYPHIFQVENTMRKLICKFMLINLGLGWYKSVVPVEVKDSIKSSKAKLGNGILYEVDFIQLSDFLFKPYSIKDISKLPDILEKALSVDLTKEKREEILEYIPKNNWDRYISKIVNCESDQLKKKWTKLYEIRCIVAHNNSLTIDEYNEGLELCNHLMLILKSAFDKLNNIVIPKEEIEDISLNTIATVHEPTKAFINDYNNFKIGFTSIINHDNNTLNSISDYSNSINWIHNTNSFLPENLKSTIDAIEKAKSSILFSENLEKLNNITNNYNVLFNNANDILTQYSEIKSPTDSISIYYLDKNKNKDKDKDKDKGKDKDKDKDKGKDKGK